MESVKFKTLITVGLILFAGAMAGLFTAANFIGSNNIRTADGIVIDFGGFENQWFHADDTNVSVTSFLDSLSENESIQIVWEKHGESIKSINDKENDSTHSWHLWAVEKGDTEYQKLGSYSNLISKYTVNTVAYTETDSKPVPATDYLGNSIFGLNNCKRTVTLSPSITEIVSYLGAVDTIVGSDSVSDYPDSFVQKKDRGEVSVVADLLNVSIEKVVSVKPDVVFFDGSATNTVNTAKQLNSTTSIDSVVLFPGSTSFVIMKNILITGIALGEEFQKTAMDNLKKIYAAYEAIKEVTSSVTTKKTGVVIMSDQGSTKDWAAGWNTSISDYFKTVGCRNGFDSLISTWENFNAEQLQNIDPDFIIVISSTYRGSSGYSDLLDAHKSTWQSLKAWGSGKIFLLYDKANDITSRLGPRFIHCTELFAKIAYPDLFETKIAKKYLGDDYIDYIDISKESAKFV